MELSLKGSRLPGARLNYWHHVQVGKGVSHCRLTLKVRTTLGLELSATDLPGELSECTNRVRLW